MGRTRKEQLWEIQGGRCHYCQASLCYADADTDHLHPKSRGGDNSLKNRVLCCVRVNRWFGDMPHNEKMCLVQQWRESWRKRNCKPTCFYVMFVKK